jgi:hypothetical protein
MSTEIKLYPSSVAFQEGDLVFTKYASGCHRNIFLRLNGVRETINEIHGERGKIAEDDFQQTSGISSIPFKREVPFKLTFDEYPGVVVSGRMDYVLYPEDETLKRVVELKSTESTNVLREVIRNGKIKLENVAQLVTYLIAEKCVRGQLTYCYYKRSKKDGSLTKMDSRDFIVNITDTGRILVDGVWSGFEVRNVIEHYIGSVRCVNSGILSSRPYNGKSFDGACKYCPYSRSCDMYDSGLISKEDFIYASKEALSKGNK